MDNNLKKGLTMLNVGRNIYGKWIVIVMMIVSFIGCSSKNMGTSTLYNPEPLTNNVTKNEVCQDLTPSLPSSSSNGYLKRFYKPADINKENKIKKNDSLYISLQYAQFINLTEASKNIFNFSNSKAEVAILANIKEYDGGIDYSSDSSKNARVIYFSEGVQATGQALNFTAIPMYGPIQYNGGIVVIQLYVLEVDQPESQQFASVIKQIASLGTALYPPASSQLQMLESIGGALLSAGGDDKEFSHVLGLHPDTGRLHIPQSILQLGNIVLIKDEHQKLKANVIPESNHQKYCLNSLDGRLYYKDNENQSRLVTDKSYLVIQINSGYANLANKVNNEQTYAKLMQTELKRINSNEQKSTQELVKLIKTSQEKSAFDEVLLYLREASRLDSTFNELTSKEGSQSNDKKNIIEKYNNRISHALEKLRRAVNAEDSNNTIMTSSQISDAFIELQEIVPKNKRTEIIRATFIGKELSEILETLELLK